MRPALTQRALNAASIEITYSVDMRYFTEAPRVEISTRFSSWDEIRLTSSSPPKRKKFNRRRHI